MALDPFPPLERALVACFGPAAGIFLHQLIYWYRKPRMRHREWAYKTAGEWRDERGLSRRQVDEARRKLAKAGVLEEKHGRGNKLFYRVDWVRLACILSLHGPDGEKTRTGTPESPEIGRASSECTAENGTAPHFHAGKAPKSAVQSSLHGQNGGSGHMPNGHKPHSYAEPDDVSDPEKVLIPRASSLQESTQESTSRKPALAEREEDASAGTAPALPSPPYSSVEDGKGPTDDPAPAPEPPRFDPSTDALYGTALRLTGDPDHPAGRLARRCLAGEDVFEDLLLAVAGGDPVRAERSRARVRLALEGIVAAGDEAGL